MVLSAGDIKAYMLMTLKALAFCHSQWVLHRYAVPRPWSPSWNPSCCPPLPLPPQTERFVHGSPQSWCAGALPRGVKSHGREGQQAVLFLWCALGTDTPWDGVAAGT